jgi:predicted dehydrogenase
MDNGPHAFDVLSHVLDSAIDDASGSFAIPVVAPPVEDTATIVFKTASGSTGRIELSWVYFSKDLDYLVVQGTEGTLRVGWTGGQFRRHGDREWLPFGTGYDKLASFRGVWGAFVGPDVGAAREPGPLAALDLIDRVYAGDRAK